MAIDKQFIEQFISVTSKAALAASYLVGKNNKIAADKAAVDSMRTELNKINMTGKVVIGEGALDEAPLLYTGEILGVHMVGAGVTELIHNFSLVIEAEIIQENIENTIFPHPTLSEAIHESVLKASGKEIHI